MLVEVLVEELAVNFVVVVKRVVDEDVLVNVESVVVVVVVVVVGASVVSLVTSVAKIIMQTTKILRLFCIFYFVLFIFQQFNDLFFL